MITKTQKTLLCAFLHTIGSTPPPQFRTQNWGGPFEKIRLDTDTTEPHHGLSEAWAAGICYLVMFIYIGFGTIIRTHPKTSVLISAIPVADMLVCVIMILFSYRTDIIGMAVVATISVLSLTLCLWLLSGFSADETVITRVNIWIAYACLSIKSALVCQRIAMRVLRQPPMDSIVIAFIIGEMLEMGNNDIWRRLLSSDGTIHLGRNSWTHRLLEDREQRLGISRTHAETSLLDLSRSARTILLSDMFCAFKTPDKNDDRLWIAQQTILSWQSQSPRAVATQIEKINMDDLVEATKHKPTDRSEFGELFLFRTRNAPVRMLRIKDPAENDRSVWSIAPAWISSAHEAVAWSFQTPTANYKPDLQS